MFPITSRISHLQRIFCCIFRKHGETSPGAKLLFTPEQQGREVEHSLGALRTTPHTYYGCSTLSGLPSESKARSFSQKLNVVHASLREWGLLSASATWSIRSLGKCTASFKPGHTDVCLDKADGVCRREVGTARLPAVTLPCLECLITHIHSYLYYYPYYFIYILLYYHIGVLMYCYIV